MENIPCDALLLKLHLDYWETQSEAQVSHLSKKNCSSTQTEYKAPAWTSKNVPGSQHSYVGNCLSPARLLQKEMLE